jgi:hypothetical protein
VVLQVHILVQETAEDLEEVVDLIMEHLEQEILRQ